MYWFNSRLKATLTFAVILIAVGSCRPEVESGRALKLFDLEGYFKGEIKRLNISKPIVNKTVGHNDAIETHPVKIENWAKELDLYVSSAINKPAWQKSYKADTSGSIILYKAIDPKLKTREVLVKKEAGKVKYVVIINSVKNLLYRTDEKLTYFPDSLYMIEKLQQVKLLGRNKYVIKGFLN